MGTVDEATLELLDTVLELVHHAVHRGERVGGGGPGPDDEPVALHGDLAHLALGDAGVALLRELDLGPLHALEEPAQPGDLVLDRGAQRLGHLDVATVDGDVHPTLLSLPAPGTAAQGVTPRPHRAQRSGVASDAASPVVVLTRYRRPARGPCLSVGSLDHASRAGPVTGGRRRGSARGRRPGPRSRASAPPPPAPAPWPRHRPSRRDRRARARARPRAETGGPGRRRGKRSSPMTSERRSVTLSGGRRRRPDGPGPVGRVGGPLPLR